MSEIINAVKCGICGEKVKAHDPDDHECKPKKYCEKWDKNYPKIFNVFAMGKNRNWPEYDGDYFIHCPWCGKELPCG